MSAFPPGCGGNTERGQLEADAEGATEATTAGEGESAAQDQAEVQLGECNPLEDDCPNGRYCQIEPAGPRCIPVGNTQRDDICEDTGSCVRGSICLYGSKLYGKHCQQPCPLDVDDWTICDNARHTCFVAVDGDGNELPFGVCRYSE